MFRTAKTVEMLKPIALVAGLAILLWSLGLPSLRLADAASLTDVKDTLSDSAPSASANHEIEFISPTGVATSSTIVLTFPASSFGLTNIGEEDIDLLVNGSNVTNANWSTATTATTITLTLGATSIPAGATTTLLIGLNATNQGTPNTQIVNPAAEGSYEINISAGASDSGATRVVILSAVTVTATVNTIFNFSVAGLGTGVSVNGETTGITTSSTSIPFGTLAAGVATTGAHRLSVSTNATNGYVVTVQSDQAFQSSTGADIDMFSNGAYSNSPSTWASPSATVGAENTYGHWGITSDDATIDSRTANQFSANEFISASTTPHEIMQHSGPANGQTMGVGTTTVGYKVQISALQEAGDDYTTTLTYIATPTF